MPLSDVVFAPIIVPVKPLAMAVPVWHWDIRRYRHINFLIRVPVPISGWGHIWIMRVAERDLQKKRPLLGAAGIVIEPAYRCMGRIKVVILLA